LACGLGFLGPSTFGLDNWLGGRSWFTGLSNAWSLFFFIFVSVLINILPLLYVFFSFYYFFYLNLD
jgi:hypothetical protein